MRLEEWLVQRFGLEKFNPGLERVQKFLSTELAHLAQKKTKIVTVAGTNGKGETAYTLAQMARDSGVGFVLWTSPHLLSVTERFVSSDGEIGVEELSQLLHQVTTDSEQWQIGLSYYEALWVAFVRFALKKNPELWILEVGLGGRFDAVNVVDADVVALTSISRDHQEFLGKTYASILKEKLGVTRRGKALVSALESRYLQKLTQESVDENGVQWSDLFAQGILDKEDAFTLRNRKLAQSAWEKLKLPRVALPEMPFPGRGEEWVYGIHTFVFYGPHNPDGMRKLVQLLKGSSYNQREFHHVWAAFSHRSSEDLNCMLKTVKQLESPTTKVTLTNFAHPKAAAMNWWRSNGLQVSEIEQWKDLLELLPATPQKILVCGSYYFAALVMSELQIRGGLSSVPPPPVSSRGFSSVSTR